MTKLLSDQVDEKEIAVICRELNEILTKNIQGDIVEFGCYVGTTSVYLAAALMHTERKLYLYDSFEGLPEKTPEDISPIGEQFKPGELMATRKRLIKNLTNAGVPMPRIKKAWFRDLEKKNIPERIAFAFLDGDYYGSVTDSLKLVWPQLEVGSVVIVDDYGNAALPGASKAVDDWLSSHSAKLRVEQSLAIITL